MNSENIGFPIINTRDSSKILNSIGSKNLIGKGFDGSIYMIDYYNIPAVVKIPNNIDRQNNINNEIIIYRYICRVFNNCLCKDNIVQLLGYDLDKKIMVLEYFDGYDLAKYTGYPISDVTFNSHRLLPRNKPGSADFETLKRYLNTYNINDTIFRLFDKIYTGLLCLHTIGILHKDFELKNILIRKDGKVGISDFGLSLNITPDITNKSYPFSTFLASFGTDIKTIGPMIGNFLDSSDQEPYQYRLDEKRVNYREVLNRITDRQINDIFLFFIKFSNIAEFVSMCYNINRNLDMNSSNSLIDQTVANYNSIITGLIDEHQRDPFFINSFDHIFIKNKILHDFISDPGLSQLVSYFRVIMNKIFSLNGSRHLHVNESVNNYIMENFESNYDFIIESCVNIIDNGFLLKYFDLFISIYGLNRQ
jgi:serine/threonine protein kinase